MKNILFIFLFGASLGLKPADIAKRVAIRTKNAIKEGTLSCYVNFGTWNYEGAMIFRGLWELQSAMKNHSDFEIEDFLNKKLDFYKVRRKKLF